MLPLRCCRALAYDGAQDSALQTSLPSSTPPTPDTDVPPGRSSANGSQAEAASSQGLTDAEAVLGDAITSFSGGSSLETSPGGSGISIPLPAPPPPQANICKLRCRMRWICGILSLRTALLHTLLTAAAHIISLLDPPTDGSLVAPNLTQPQRNNLPRLRRLRQGLGTATANRWAC